jgi:hypothetical protein
MKAVFENIAEDGFDKHFPLTYSNKNSLIHPSCREYFDKPISFEKKGFLFTPKYRQPFDLLSPHIDNATSARSFKRSSSIVSAATNGMPDKMIFPSKLIAEPKILCKAGAELSTSFGMIPNLRPDKKEKRPRKLSPIACLAHKRHSSVAI